MTINSLNISGTILNNLAPLTLMSSPLIGAALFIKINSTFDYALGKLLGNKYGKDLNNRIFVYIPYHQSIWKNLLVGSISSLISFRIATLAKLLVTHSSFSRNNFFTISSFAVPLIFMIAKTFLDYDLGPFEKGVYTIYQK
ncbi:MAG: hypothetical protein H0V82_09070 [Candidatus Protochlamydia sp.]|nr:hypothetical protein [Candidatus Protochlamydia sp.]